jgi:hypothetical protein
VACENYVDFCGYIEIEASLDQSGYLAVAALAPATQGMDVVTSSSTNGKTWATAKVFNTPGSSYNLSLKGLKKGFMLGWGETLEGKRAKYSILKTPGKNSWATPKVITEGNDSVSGQWHLRNSTTATYVWAARNGQLKLRDYSLTKGKFLKAAVTVKSGVDSIVDFRVSVASSSQLVITWTARTNSPLASNIETVKIPSSNLVPTITMVAASTDESVFSLLDMKFSNSGSQSILYEELTGNGSKLMYGVEHSGSLVTRREVPTLNPAQSNVGLYLLPTGNLNVISRGVNEWDADLEVVQVKTAKAPQLIQNRTISGVAQVGKTLSLTAAKWHSVAKLTSTSTQWYRCSTAKVAAGTVPLGCSKISGATKTTYKATKSDKGRYLIAVSKAANQVATTILSTESTSVVR